MSNEKGCGCHHSDENVVEVFDVGSVIKDLEAVLEDTINEYEQATNCRVVSTYINHGWGHEKDESGNFVKENDGTLKMIPTLSIKVTVESK